MEQIDAHQVAGEIEEGENEEEVLRSEEMSVNVMHFEPGDSDEMHSHDVQEVYHVTKGSAALNVEGEVVDVEEGHIVHVEPGEEHAFQDFDGEFVVTVFYAPAAHEH